MKIAVYARRRCLFCRRQRAVCAGFLATFRRDIEPSLFAINVFPSARQSSRDSMQKQSRVISVMIFMIETASTDITVFIRQADALAALNIIIR